MKLISDSYSFAENEIPIEIQQSGRDTLWRVAVTEDDTLFLLKLLFQETLSAFTDEQSFVISPQLPYALSDNLLLSRLRPEHRRLYVIVYEAQGPSVPQRYLSLDHPTRLDLRYLHILSIPRIGMWLSACREIEEIIVSAIHPCIAEIIYAISDYILLLPHIRLVHIQHPSDPSYTYPLLYNQRFMDVDHTSLITRPLLQYLYQTLLTDQYTAMEEQVEIRLDTGVLGNPLPLRWNSNRT